MGCFCGFVQGGEKSVNLKNDGSVSGKHGKKDSPHPIVIVGIDLHHQGGPIDPYGILIRPENQGAVVYLSFISFKNFSLSALYAFKTERISSIPLNIVPPWFNFWNNLTMLRRFWIMSIFLFIGTPHNPTIGLLKNHCCPVKQ